MFYLEQQNFTRAEFLAEFTINFYIDHILQNFVVCANIFEIVIFSKTYIMLN